MPVVERTEWRTLAGLTLATLALVLVLAASGTALGARSAPARPAELGVGLAAAFAGGLLALLSPCSGAILPAFFAFAFDTPRRLVAATYVFYLGLVTTFVPLGFASSLLARAMLAAPDVLYVAMGLLLAGAGALVLSGRDLVLPGPWSRAASAPGRARDGLPRAFLVGVTFGIATTSCIAPILGALVGLAAGGGFSALQSIPLFMAFALGIAAPVLVLAAGFDRWGRGALRRAAFASVALPWGRLPLAKLLSGSALLLLGIVYATTRGTTDLTSAYDRWGATRIAYEWSHAVLRNPVAGAIAFAALGGLVAWLAWSARRRERNA